MGESYIGYVDIAECIKNKSMSLVEMGKFKCHKEVHAIPMTRGAYNNARERTIPGNQDDDGYLIVYSCGTGDEYVSWSPKRVFDEGYTKI